MADYGATDRVRKSAVQTFIEPARKRGETFVKINSGVFGRSLVAKKLLPENRFPIVCNALRSNKFLKENHLTLLKIEGPPSGRSSTVEFTYKLQPQAPPTPVSPPSTERFNAAMAAFEKLRGISADFYREVGGAEAYHNKMRDDWDR